MRNSSRWASSFVPEVPRKNIAIWIHYNGGLVRIRLIKQTYPPKALACDGSCARRARSQNISGHQRSRMPQAPKHQLRHLYNIYINPRTPRSYRNNPRCNIILDFFTSYLYFRTVCQKFCSIFFDTSHIIKLC